jgi:D-alanyl-D-alanine carboxypeptidase
VDYNQSVFLCELDKGAIRLTVHRNLRVLVLGCFIFGAVVCPATIEIAAQSRPSKSVNSRVGAKNVKPAGRTDVERFRQRADAALSAAGPDKGAWGVLVSDASTGESLYARNPAGYFMPASNAKLFTTAFALATLGPDYRVRTTVSSNATLDANGI